MQPLVDILLQTRSVLPEPWSQRHARLFEVAHLEKLAQRLSSCWQNGVPTEYPQPHFNVECTPPLAESYRFFQEALASFHLPATSPEEAVAHFAKAMEQAECKNILILLGQRLTPASITDERAIPLTKSQLLESVQAMYNKEMTVGGRAWTKHAHRSPDKFWGEVRGSSGDKNNSALHIISYILDNTTWWNVFGHYQHETVFEVREPMGHGVRWGKNCKELIGFLEPFEQAE